MLFNSALALLLIASLGLMPVIASGVSPQPTDISSAQPVGSTNPTATVDATGAPDAVFSAQLNAGDVLATSLNLPLGVDATIQVFSPEATSVSQTWFLVPTVGSGQPTVIVFTASATGTYYLDVHATNGAGVVQLLPVTRRATRTHIEGNRTVVPHKGSATLTPSMVDSSGHPQVGATLAIDRSYDGASWTYWMSVHTGAAGGAVVTAVPTRKTYYRARFVGTSGLLASTSTESPSVSPQVGLGRPVAPAKMTPNKSYTISGTLKPRQSSGSRLVSLRAYYYEGGSWVLKKTVSTKAKNYSSYSKYSGKIALGTPGKWQLRAYVASGSKYAETLTSAKSVTVPKQKAAKVSAWVDDASPDRYSDVTAYAKVKDPYGKVIPGAKVVFTWHYKTSTQSETWYTDSTGTAWCERFISGARSGRRVSITIKASAGGGSAKGSTGFTPN